MREIGLDPTGHAREGAGTRQSEIVEPAHHLAGHVGLGTQEGRARVDALGLPDDCLEARVAEVEGDPQIKSKRRQKQMKMSLNRMIKAMEEADVVITNPTHLAIALKFDLDTMETPVVVAKGEGFLAEKIKEKAQELKIAIVENKPLARALNAGTEIGDEIPVDLYQAVAEVLAFVYRSSKKYR